MLAAQAGSTTSAGKPQFPRTAKTLLILHACVLARAVIVRPSSDNMRDVRQELADPKFDEYHLFFTNTLQDHQLQDIARADLSQVEEGFICYAVALVEAGLVGYAVALVKM